jgi:hypothetical protein
MNGLNGRHGTIADREGVQAVIKRIGWMLAGIVIGVLATSLLGPVMAQKTADQSRIKWYDLDNQNQAMENTVGHVSFLRDNKNNACWVVINGRSLSVVPAPATSCQ